MRANDAVGVPRADRLAAPRISRRMRRVRRVGWNLLPPLTFAGIVALWWLAVEGFKIPAYLLPGPGGVFEPGRAVTGAEASDAVARLERLIGPRARGERRM